MADSIKTPEPGEQKARYVHPPMQGPLCIVDVVDTGLDVKVAAGSAKLQHIVWFVYRTGHKNPETGFPVDVTERFSLSTFRNGTNASPLRIRLEQIKGEASTEKELPSFDLGMLAGRWVYGTIVNATDKNDQSKRYANIQSVMKVPEGMALPAIDPYTRASYWEEIRKRSEDRVAKSGLKPNTTQAAYGDDLGSDLPF